MAYTPDQIKQFIADKGIAGNPYAMYNYAQQYGVSPGQVDQALGATPGQSANWIRQQGLSQIGQRNAGNGAQYSDSMVKDLMGRFGGDPQSMYTMAQQTGIGADQVDRAMGYDAGTSAKWIQQQGLNPLGQPQRPPVPPGAGGPPQSMPQPGANPYMPNPTNSPTQPMAQPRQSSPVQNPYTQQMMSNITDAVNTNLQRNILPSIRRGQVANGTLGSTRQGIAEGIAIGDTNKALANAATNLYANQFNQDRNYGLQSDALDLNVYNANQNWMRTGQQDQLNFIDRMLGWNQMGQQTAQQAYYQPLQNWQQFVGPAAQLGGMGGTATQYLQGNPWLGAFGGYLAGSQMKF